MDDFLLTSILSSPYFRELIITQVDTITDPHIHVSLFTTTVRNNNNNNTIGKGNTHTTITDNNNNNNRNAESEPMMMMHKPRGSGVVVDTTAVLVSRQEKIWWNRKQKPSTSVDTTPTPGKDHSSIKTNRFTTTISNQQNKPHIVTFEYCSKVTNSSLLSITKTCSYKQLKRLSIRGCSNITSFDGLSDLSVPKLKNESFFLPLFAPLLPPPPPPPHTSSSSMRTKVVGLASLFAGPQLSTLKPPQKCSIFEFL